MRARLLHADYERLFHDLSDRSNWREDGDYLVSSLHVLKRVGLLEYAVRFTDSPDWMTIEGGRCTVAASDLWLYAHSTLA